MCPLIPCEEALNVEVLLELEDIRHKAKEASQTMHDNPKHLKEEIKQVVLGRVLLVSSLQRNLFFFKLKNLVSL